MIYHQTETGTLYHGDVLDAMRNIQDKSVNCVITSPPYYRKRDYKFPDQWGWEKTYQEYLNRLLLLMIEIKRVLTDDGTVFINIGDTYGKTGRDRKKLLLIPQRFLIGCFEQEWIIRNDIIWAKTNGMPESIKDRLTNKYEHVFFMTKKTKYYFDLESIKEPWKPDSIARACRAVSGNGKYSKSEYGQKIQTGNMKRERRSPDQVGEKKKNPGDVTDFWAISTKNNKTNHTAPFNEELITKPIKAGCPEEGTILDPFCKSGTTLILAAKLNRKWIGIDGSEEACHIAKTEMEKL